MKFTIAQEEYAADLLNRHSKTVEAHWEATLSAIGSHLMLSREQVEELIQTNNVRDMWNQ